MRILIVVYCKNFSNKIFILKTSFALKNSNLTRKKTTQQILFWQHQLTVLNFYLPWFSLNKFFQIAFPLFSVATQKIHSCKLTDRTHPVGQT